MIAQAKPLVDEILHEAGIRARRRHLVLALAAGIAGGLIGALGLALLILTVKLLS